MPEASRKAIWTCPAVRHSAAVKRSRRKYGDRTPDHRVASCRSEAILSLCIASRLGFFKRFSASFSLNDHSERYPWTSWTTYYHPDMTGNPADLTSCAYRSAAELRCGLLFQSGQLGHHVLDIAEKNRRQVGLRRFETVARPDGGIWTAVVRKPLVHNVSSRSVRRMSRRALIEVSQERRCIFICVGAEG
jgi:hypothetical protein